MDRDNLIQQVKSEYARLADQESREHFTDLSYGATSPAAYYEQALAKAIQGIAAGKYDDCVSGLQVIEKIANNKTKVQRIQATIESTLRNMEIAEEMIAANPDDKKAQILQADNERRAEAIPQLIRDMKEEQALEELESDSPNVIGGGS